MAYVGGRLKPRLKGLPLVGHKTRLRGLAEIWARGGGGWAARRPASGWVARRPASHPAAEAAAKGLRSATATKPASAGWGDSGEGWRRIESGSDGRGGNRFIESICCADVRKGREAQGDGRSRRRMSRWLSPPILRMGAQDRHAENVIAGHRKDLARLKSVTGACSLIGAHFCLHSSGHFPTMVCSA